MGIERSRGGPWVVRFRTFDLAADRYLTGDATTDNPKWTEKKEEAYQFKTKRAANEYAKPIDRLLRNEGSVRAIRY
jgi:hypothetical protein